MSFTLDTVYVGESFSVYGMPPGTTWLEKLELDKDYPLTGFKEKTLYIKQLGFQWWFPGRSLQLPTHCIQDGDKVRYLIDRRSKPGQGQDIVLVKEKNLEGKYVPIFYKERGYVVSRLFRVPEIPKLFDWYGRGFLARVEDVYLDVPQESLQPLELNWVELKELEQLGVSVFPMFYFYQNAVYAVGYGIPVPMWLKGTANLFPYSPLINRIEISPYLQLYEPSVPCRVDAETKKLVYLEDDEGRVWVSKPTREVSAEEAKEMWGLPNAGALRYNKGDDQIDIPVEEVLEVGQNDSLELLPLFNGQIALKVADSKYFKNLKRRRGSFPTSLSKLLVKNPVPIRNSAPCGLWLINPGVDYRSLGLVKMKRGQRSSRIPFRLGYVQDGQVHLLPGCYCSEEHALPYRRVTKADYDALKLQYELPGARYEWQLEDVIQYNDLLSKNLYAEAPRVQLGSVSVTISKNFALEFRWPQFIFVNKAGTIWHRIWQTLSWSECVTHFQKYPKADSESYATFNDILLLAVALGADPEVVLDMFADRYQLTEIERLLLST